jgi:hypothetical protein
MMRATFRRFLVAGAGLLLLVVQSQPGLLFAGEPPESNAEATAAPTQLADDQLLAQATRLGISLDEAIRRQYIQSASQDAVAAVMRNGEQFAGVLFDDTEGWYRLHVFYVGNNPGRVDVERLLPPDVPVEWTRVDHSYDELSAIQNKIVALHNDTVAQGGEPLFSSTGIDPARNKVKVALSEENDAVRSFLQARFRDSIYIVVEPPPPPL